MNELRNQMIPDDPDHLPPARRRQARRLLVPLDGDKQAEFIEQMAASSAPSVDFFLFSLISGLVMGAGLLVDHPGLLVFGLLVAPLLAPVVGLSVGVALGAPAQFGRSLLAFTIGCGFVLVGGLAAGLVSEFWFPGADSLMLQARFHARLNWVYALVAVYGALATAITLARRPEHAGLPSVALAYSLYLPLVVAGFGLSAGLPELWPAGLVIFAVHLAGTVLLAAFALAFMGCRPSSVFGYTLGGAFALLAVVVLLGVSGAGVAVTGQIAIPTFTPSPTLTLTPTETPTATPVPPTATPVPPTATSTFTPVPPTETFTPSPVPPTATPVPVFAVVSAVGDTGAFIRSSPAGERIKVLANGTLVRVLEQPVVVDRQEWFHVLTPDGIDGWMLGLVITIATPQPNWGP